MEKHKPYIAMIFIQILYAGMALLSKAAMSKGTSPYVFVFYRQVFATVALAPFAYSLESNKSAPLSYNALLKIFLFSFFGLTLSLNLYYVALNYTTATFAAATTNTVPAITFIIASLLRMESITLKHVPGLAKVLGSVCGVSGALVFAFVKGPTIGIVKSHHQIREQILGGSTTTSGESYTVEWIKGSLIMISANTFWSLWLVLQGALVKQYPAKLRLTTLQCFFSCIQSGIWAIAMERNPSAWKLGWDVHLLAVAYCGIIINGITYWLQVWAIQRKGPVFTAMFTPLALIITATVSAIIWKETLHLGSVGGAILLVCGLYSVLWGKNREDVVHGRPNVASEQVAETKDESNLECITTQGQMPMVPTAQGVNELMKI